MGTLPVRYLGLPLMSRKLKINEYSPLLDKIKGKFRSWAVKSLSFAGRVQLIASVIYGIINFWISTFSLPKGCLRLIESLCSRFLWAGNIEGRSTAKVSWSSVCLPKAEGGLGLRRLSAWNNILSLRLIWLLFSGSGSLWVAWHKHHQRLSERSFWSVKETRNDSWSWKCLLKLRHLVIHFIKGILGNGKATWFWHDNWTPLGPLKNLFGDQGPQNLRIPISAQVADACNNIGWTLAAPRSDHAEALQIYLSSIHLPSASSQEDYVEWVIDGKSCLDFSSTKTWDKLSPRSSAKYWAPLIWFKGHTPKYAFNM